MMTLTEEAALVVNQQQCRTSRALDGIGGVIVNDKRYSSTTWVNIGVD